MTATPLQVPAHQVGIARRDTYADVWLIVDGEVVARTSLDREVTKQSAPVQAFVRGYFHLPGPSRKPK